MNVAPIWHGQGERLLEIWQAGRPAAAGAFELRAEAERWAGWAGADRLVSLDSLRGVERFPVCLCGGAGVVRMLRGRMGGYGKGWFSQTPQ